MKGQGGLLTLLAAAVLVAPACPGCSSGSAPRVLPGDNADSGFDATRADDGAMSSPDADDAAIDGAKDGAGDAAPDSDGGDGGPASPPECSETDAWSTIARVSSIAASGFDRFGSITENELTVAWTSAAGEIFVADRASTTAAFGTPALLNPGATLLANDRVALVGPGTQLIATLLDGSSFATFLRTSPGTSWVPGDAGIFQYVAAMISESGGLLSQPVVSADGLALFYLLVIGPNLPVLYESAWDKNMGAWDVGVPLAGADFAIASATQLRRVTGASSDRRTLFFYDEVAGHERAAWRDFPTSAFDVFVDLPNVPEAAPSGNCNTLYFHGTDSTGQGLFTAE
jgi:hypothetical protein